MHNYKYNSVKDCEICKNLADIEGGCKKESEDKELLPPIAYKLQNVPLPSWMGVLEKCPLCGTYYQYIQYYEYSPNGNEEEEHLNRLSPKDVVGNLILAELFSELNIFATTNKENAKLVLVEINQSKLNKNTKEFKELVKSCKEILSDK